MTNREKYFHVACLAYMITASAALVVMAFALGDMRGRVTESLSCDAFRAERTERIVNQMQAFGRQNGLKKSGV